MQLFTKLKNIQSKINAGYNVCMKKKKKKKGRKKRKCTSQVILVNIAPSSKESTSSLKQEALCSVTLQAFTFSTIININDITVGKCPKEKEK